MMEEEGPQFSFIASFKFLLTLKKETLFFNNLCIQGNGYAVKEGNPVKMVFTALMESGISTLKEKTLLPGRVFPFRLGILESKQKVKKSSPF